jgi:hypothetical protein
MRNALLTAALLIAAIAALAADNETPPPPSVSLFPGTDQPEAKQCPDGAAYIYNGYIIYVKPAADLPGQDIDIYKPPSPPRDPCGADKGAKYYPVPAGGSGGAKYFAGVSGEYLFIDQGTGPSYRTLSIFDMREKTFPLAAVRYSDAKIENGLFTYYETRDEVEGILAKIPCPKASEWKRQGLNVVYEERMSFDLGTGKQSSLRQFRCSPAQ